MDGLGEALKQISEMGDASRIFLIEEGMVGEEFSYYGIVDGEHYICFKSAQDNKRVWNRDLGPNTGGMGCNAPALVTKGLEAQIESEIIAPTVAKLAEEGVPYKGILYLGGMVCEDGSVKIVEYNSRWGDPECHVILPGIQNDYFEMVNAAVDGRLNDIKLVEDDLVRVCTIGASAGYPGSYEKGRRLIIDESNFPEGVEWLSAGIKVKDGRMYTAGGRVFSVIGKGKDVIEARRSSLQGMACCSIADNGLHYRTDTAWRDVQRVQEI
jgi:phosphoribosylamine---glycine ligase